MKLYKLFLIISLVLILSVKVFGQAAVDVPLLITESNDPTVFEMAVGLDLTATNCIDPQLGEFKLFGPPPGGFYIVFDLSPYGCPGLATWKDYRDATTGFPFTGSIEHTMGWQRSAPSTEIYVQYNLPPGAAMRIRDQIGGSILNLGPFTGTGTAVIPGSYPFTAALLLMDYTDILPVELTSFTALVLENEKSVQLNWITATEINNSGFEIQRLQDSKIERLKDWEVIGFVPGFGTTTEHKSYSFTDENVTNGINKYRLKQIDFDGSFTYSNEIQIEVDFTPKEIVLYQNYPNPFNPSTTISYSLPVESRVKINIYNSIGQVIEEIKNEIHNPGKYELSWNAENNSSGIYFYSFEVTSVDGSKSHREMKKIVFLK